MAISMRPFYIILIVFIILACVFAGYILVNHFTTKHIRNPGPTSKAIPVSGPIKITKPGLYQLTGNQIPKSLNKTNSMESIFINIRSSNVIFDGMGYVIDGKNIGTPCFSLNSNICEWTYGIYAGSSWDQQYQYTNITVRNVTVSNWRTGFHLSSAKDIFIVNSVFSENDCGIRSFCSSNITIHHNSFLSNHGSGIEGRDNEKFTISDNVIAHNKNTGITMDGGAIERWAYLSVPLALQSLFGPQIVVSQFGAVKRVLMTSDFGHTISGNEIIDNQGGIYLKKYVNNTIEQNLIQDIRNYGLWLDTIDDTMVKDNTFVNNSFGISGRERISIFKQNCGPNLFFLNNTGTSGTGKTDNYSKTVPISLITGPVLIVLLKILTGATTIYSKIQESRLYKRIKIKTQSIEVLIRCVTQSDGMFSISERAVVVTIVGALIFGGAYAYTSSDKFTIESFGILMFISGIVTVTPRVFQYLIAQKNGIPLEYRMWLGGIIIILITMIIPGSIFGQSVRTDLDGEERYDKNHIGLTKLAGSLICILLSVGFFLLFFMKGPYAIIGMQGLTMSLLSAVVLLLPVSPMDGEQVFKWNKYIWAVFFFPVFICYGYLLFIS